MYNCSCRHYSKNAGKTTTNNLCGRWYYPHFRDVNTEAQGRSGMRPGWRLKMAAPGLKTRPDALLRPSMWILPTHVHGNPSHSIQLHPEQDREASKSAFPSNLATERDQLQRAAVTTWSISPLLPACPQFPTCLQRKAKTHMLSQGMLHSVTRVRGWRRAHNWCHTTQWRAATLAAQTLSTS